MLHLESFNVVQYFSTLFSFSDMERVKEGLGDKIALSIQYLSLFLAGKLTSFNLFFVLFVWFIKQNTMFTKNCSGKEQNYTANYKIYKRLALLVTKKQRGKMAENTSVKNKRLFTWAKPWD